MGIVIVLISIEIIRDVIKCDIEFCRNCLYAPIYSVSSGRAGLFRTPDRDVVVENNVDVFVSPGQFCP